MERCESAVEWSGMERGHHSTEGTVDRGCDGLIGQGTDSVSHQRTRRGVNDAVDVLNNCSLKLEDQENCYMDSTKILYCADSVFNDSM